MCDYCKESNLLDAEPPNDLLTEDVALALRPLIGERILDLENGCHETFEGEAVALRQLGSHVAGVIYRKAK